MEIISVIGFTVVSGYVIASFTGKTGIFNDIISAGISVFNGMIDRYVHDPDFEVKEKIKQIEMKRIPVVKKEEEEPGKYEIHL